MPIRTISFMKAMPLMFLSARERDTAPPLFSRVLLTKTDFPSNLASNLLTRELSRRTRKEREITSHTSRNPKSNT